MSVFMRENVYIYSYSMYSIPNDTDIVCVSMLVR